MQAIFEIKFSDLHWIDRKDDPADLCLHGKLFLKVDNEIISDNNSFDITLSAAVLFLMRTIHQNYKKDDFENFLFPCCGQIMYVEESADEEKLKLSGCNNGIDLTINHLNGKVRIVSEKGSEALLEFSEYKRLVLELAKQVEVFYELSHPKQPSDPYAQKAYQLFQEEWKKLRNT